MANEEFKKAALQMLRHRIKPCTAAITFTVQKVLGSFAVSLCCVFIRSLREIRRMTGYTPVFQSIFSGSLHGQWPDVGLWLCMLAMADRRGHVDCTPKFISSITGLPVSEVQDCINRFLERDDFSRTRENEGRRLELIDPARAWGWKIINHAHYREKARLMAKDSARTESGRDAERKRAARSSPPLSPASPLSDKTKQDKKDMSTSSTALVFDHWKTIFNHPRAVLDVKRRKTIDAALKDFTVDELKNAITGYRNSKFHMGDNDRRQVYDGIELLLRDAKHIESGIELASKQPEQKWT